ncbi:MAG: hypothetical protein ABIP79_01480 [Chitinophagaceae bacterium]
MYNSHTRVRKNAACVAAPWQLFSSTRHLNVETSNFKKYSLLDVVGGVQTPNTA